MALDATVGGATANSYVTEQAAMGFLQEHLSPDAWYDDSGDDERILPLSMRRVAALIQATRLLDTYIQWYGTPTTTIQVLAWPQQNQRDRWGNPIASTIVPDVIQRATAYYALSLLEEQAQAPAIEDIALIKSRKIGDLSVTYRDTAQAPPPSERIPADIRQLLKPYGHIAGGVTVPLVRS